MLYSVWEDGQDVSIDLDLESAKEFAHESNTRFEVRSVDTGEVVYRAEDYKFSRYYKEPVL